VDNATGSYLPDQAYIRAFDKDTGDVVWEQKLPLLPYGVPMTYLYQGKQYIAVACGGQGAPAAVLAFALKD
jgi:quinoprotein glucose dehydrogenase